MMVNNSTNNRKMSNQLWTMMVNKSTNINKMSNHLWRMMGQQFNQ
jgi:hypothetical protein